MREQHYYGFGGKGSVRPQDFSNTTESYKDREVEQDA